ncbi:MAG: DUF885 domain-containing protein [Alphaproteobacteria bacterium]|nr:DUF885 domain-containing protein [Alphaproteobacteria bacterium]
MRPPVLAAIVMGIVMTFAVAPAVAQPAGKTLAKLFDDERAFVWREDPLAATGEGVRRYDDRLPSVTPQAQARRLEADQQFVQRLHAIKRAKLSAQQQVSYDLFDFMVASRVALGRHKEWRIPFNSDSGFFADLLQLGSLADPQTVKQYEDYIARLNDVPRYFDENIANIRTGMRDGFTLPAAVLDGVSKVVAGAQYKNAEDTPLWHPFANFPDGVPERDRARLSAAGKAALTNAVGPAYAAFQTFFESEYRAAARKTIGASELPNGRAYYGDLVRYFTTLPDATPEKIHKIGLDEVARIRAEMEAIVREVKFDGTFGEFLTFLRTDRQFYAKTPNELLREAAWISKEIDGKLPEYFGKLPRMTYAVKPVPEALAPNYTGGRYNPGPMGAAGEYWVNTFALDTRPLYVLPSLTLHEAVPGHHLQGSISRELGDVPQFRLNFYPHSYGEGWALYAEKLGLEMGVYHTPYQNFGRLTYEMWRACRLVVDTGMHAMGWTREQALAYLEANTALSKHEIRTEIDRYISWPGQALAYKMGELKIWELRAHAKAALGERFDLRAFHDAILESGGVTLPVLERRIDAYVAQARRAKKY